MQQTLLIAGVACLIAAIVGGGLRAFGIEIPALGSRVRQMLLGLLGLILIVVGTINPESPTGAGKPINGNQPRPTDEANKSGQSQATRQPPAPLEQPDPTVEVEKLVASWVAAWIDGRADDVVSASSEPFYFDQKVILTKPNLRSEYKRLWEEKGESWRGSEVQSIKVKTAREWQAGGWDPSRDRIFRNLNLTLDDYAVSVSIKQGQRAEGMLVAVRRIGSRYEVAGLWD
ncbi:MAG TPA: hypothetical protein VLM38_21590 [Blastocatellia bacterium]|nr:hypothetical protein [Blastocatellia bacterium]